jgi:hypothetical protein
MSKKQSLWKSLSCDLTQEEIATYSQELATVTGEQAEIEAEKKEVMSSFAAKLNKCIADGRVLARKIITKKEDRQVECDLDFDYAKGMVFTVRTDNGVTIGQRKLTDEERQEWLDFEGEEDRKQAAEEKREEEYLADCQNMERDEPPVIEGELLQIEHTPAEPGVSVCGNTECHYNDATEGNGCKQYEEVWECKQALQEGAEDTEAAKAEMARRDSICKTWNECEHQDICFTEQNEEDGICFKDEPHRLPVVEEPAKALTFQELMQWGYSRNEAKIIAAGFQLVKYSRDERVVSITAVDPRGGWLSSPPASTFAAAERDLATVLERPGLIEVAGNKKGGVVGHKCMHALRAVGFEFYRAERVMGPNNSGEVISKIKFGSSWRTWKKFDTPNEYEHAWNTLMTTHPFALED